MPSVASQWRTLRQRAEDPAFVARAAQEFPGLAEALARPAERRHVLKLMAAAFALGGLTGCDTGEPTGDLIPAVRYPPNIVPALPNFYTGASVLNGYAIGIVISHQMGRPIKVEGNPHHPSSLGATDVFAQAQVLDFYDPDREAQITQHSVPAGRQTMLTALAGERARLASNNGEGLRILTGTVTSPTLAAQLDALLARFPQARWHQWEAISRDAVLKGAMLAYGRPVEVIYKTDAADVILGLDSDLLSSAPGHLRYAREFASRRNPTRTAAMSRVYAVEPAPTLLGSVADHRFPAGPKEMRRIVQALAADILQSGDPPSDAPPWVRAVAADLLAHREHALVHVGPHQSGEIHAIAHAMNEALGARGSTLELIEPVAHRATDQMSSLRELAEDMHAGRVQTLLILDSNPVYTAPGPLDFAGALKRVPFSLALSRALDETSEAVTWAVPMTHEWEDWSDARGHDGTATIIQPQALPLYGGISPHVMLALFVDAEPPTAIDLVGATWKSHFGDGFDAGWHDALAQGVVPGTASAKADVRLRADLARMTLPAPPDHAATVLFRPDPHLWDGRFANNPWLQELPRPLTKLTWDNPLLVAPALAEQLKLANGDLVRLQMGEQAGITVPAWVLPGLAADCVVASLGFGRRRTGVIGEGAGFDFYPLTGRTEMPALQKGESSVQLACTDHHNLVFDVAGDFVRHGDLAGFRDNSRFLASDKPEPHLYRWVPPGPAAWAMSVDLNACIGCNACVIACQAENNIPTVGKAQVIHEREMHWLRIDRYYEGDPNDPEMFFQPVLCMHCEQAPCETVCPVGATVHDSEGLNVMVYNRCVGTRFCSNNCPYKVRRFNYFAYGREQHRPAASWNPDVTVRARGVMEKCTYCIQRIAEARLTADRENRPVAEIRTACQAACPTQVFTFGNLKDPNSEVVKRKQSPLDYALLEEQNTKPRTTYEALIRNRNPALGERGA